MRLAKSRWGKLLRGVYAHVDESYYHVHILVDDNGKPLKTHHAGHGPAGDLLREQPNATRKDLAAEYVRGVMLAQQWYHHWVGKAFSWVRNPSPRPRRSRSAALRERQEKIEAQEREILQKKAAIAAGQSEILEHAELIKKALSRLQAREEKFKRESAMLRQQSAAVGRMRHAVEDQLAVERAVRQNRYESPGVF